MKKLLITPVLLLLSMMTASGIVIVYAHNPEGGCTSRHEQSSKSRVAEVSDSNSISVTPTLVTDVISIKFTSELAPDENATYNLTDLSGNSLLSGKISDQTTDISMSSFPSSYYVVTIKTNSNAKSFKIIKR
ncbi:MAG: T9SS type A sorting domain-containing protein [Bacteroides sp.]|nr:T9SS type A sorting domain-containing protein [Bacteroides sp.]